MHGARQAIIVMIVSSFALACGNMATAPTDAATDAFLGSNEGSVEAPTDAGRESDDGAGDEADAPFVASCPACPLSAPEELASAPSAMAALPGAARFPKPAARRR